MDADVLIADIHWQNHKPYGINHEQARVILNAVAEGVHFSTACRIAGVPYATFSDWMVKGGDEASTDKGKPEPGQEREPYASFVKAVRSAEAAAELHMVQKLVSAADWDWRASGFWLKARHREKWGEPSQTVQVSTTGAVQFYLPDNGRQTPQDETDPSA